MAERNRMVPIPEFEEKAYEDWRNKIELWRKVCGVPEKEQGIFLRLKLTGKADAVVSGLDNSVIASEHGLDQLMKRLDRVFLSDGGVRQFETFMDIYELKRKEETSIRDFIVEFENTHVRFEKECGPQSGPQKAFCLLRACNLERNEVMEILTVADEIDYEKMKRILQRRFCLDKTKMSREFYKEDHKEKDVLMNEQYYGQQSRGGTTTYRGRGRAGWRGRGRGYVNYGGRGGCYVCRSNDHWAKMCPEAYWNKKIDGPKEDLSGTNNIVLMEEVLGSESSSDFEGTSLFQQARKMAVIDTGCSNTVCGEKWLADYMIGREDELVEEETQSEYSFGGESKRKAIRRVIIPCKVGGQLWRIRTDVVRNEIPLVLSIGTLERMQVNIYCTSRKVEIQGKEIETSRMKGGHLCMPLEF